MPGYSCHFFRFTLVSRPDAPLRRGLFFVSFVSSVIVCSALALRFRRLRVSCANPLPLRTAPCSSLSLAVVALSLAVQNCYSPYLSMARPFHWCSRCFLVMMMGRWGFALGYLLSACGVVAGAVVFVCCRLRCYLAASVVVVGVVGSRRRCLLTPNFRPE